MIKIVIVLMICCYIASCGGDVDGGVAAGPDDTLQPIKSSFDYVVDLEKGVDSDKYDSSIGFKTVTHAVGYVEDNFPGRLYEVTIYVEPGEYSEMSGEIFPIYIGNNVGIYGGLGTTILNMGAYNIDSLFGLSINGPVSIVLSGDAILSNFNIDFENQGIGVLVDSGEPRIYKNNIVNAGRALTILGDSAPLVINNVLKNNLLAIETRGRSRAVINRNLIIENQSGVLILNDSYPSLGTLASRGANVIKNNFDYSLCNVTGNGISAIGNDWDDLPELIVTEPICSDGIIVGNIGGGAVDISLYPVNDSSIFSVEKEIFLITPQVGKIINDNRPSFRWDMSPRKLVALGVFDQRIEVTGNEISNTGNLVFYWDSGMRGGRVGSILFDDGITYERGVAIDSPAPISLERGRNYYWAVWSWSDDGRVIVEASKEGYFTLSN